MYLKFMRVPPLPPGREGSCREGCIIQGPVVQMVDSIIQWINLHPVGSVKMPSPILICSIVVYPMDSTIQLLNNWVLILILRIRICFKKHWREVSALSLENPRWPAFHFCEKRFSGCPGAKVRCQGLLSTARAKPWKDTIEKFRF